MLAYRDLLQPAVRELGKALCTAVAIVNLPVRWLHDWVEMRLDGDLARRRRLRSKKSNAVDAFVCLSLRLMDI